MGEQVVITSEKRSEPNLRKLARALIALAQSSPAIQPTTGHEPRTAKPEAVKRTGDAA